MTTVNRIASEWGRPSRRPFRLNCATIIAKLTPEKYTEISRAKIIEPTGVAFGRSVWWSHPAYANRCLFARNDQELICLSLAAEVGK